MIALKSSPLRTAGLLVAGVSAAALALAGPAAAGQERHTETITKRVVIGDGSHEHHAAQKCAGERVEVAADRSSGGKKEQIKLVFCGEKGDSPKVLADNLAKALTRIESDSDMDPSLKAEVKSKLQAKIAELRARG